jgi:hypothetical protein
MEKNPATAEYCLIVEGNYFDESEAENALRDPFIEDYVEQTGSFRIQNFDDIEVACGISLGELKVSTIDDEIFEISCRAAAGGGTAPNSRRPLSEHKAKLLAEAVSRHGMFDEVRVEQVSTV